ncbi:hypothetical protein AVENP_1512 [Arcobacter venerupis]|uniref:Uncharacterized protein n=1 Tax=Arcobacter venerupis TaxID=1054033 RepID=A0AAE7B848_9BACT|nr:hypothetical protein [Arcobacter venerupis]QKF67064.1 hypothetical protein AVENP_1512 [Arcobacter venerupis]RWS49990.1 hypothetical protein CKA56_05795 [Arcobacter venerupis]
MKLEYAGLKPVISEHGVSFKDGKEDKFIYLSFAIDILNAIDHTYEQKKKYSHQINEKALTPDEILNVLLNFHPDLEDVMNKEIDSYSKHLDDEEAEVRNRAVLSNIEKDTFIANLKLMRKYKTQRAKNKIFYFHCIETIVEIILKYKIKELDTPFNERFWHILQTIEGKLSTHKINSNLKMIEEDAILKAMLTINIY